MRKKVKQLAYGMFDYREPELIFSTDRIELEVIEGKDGIGEFTIHSSKERKLRGMVYSAYPRMECLTPQFEGEEVRIRYQFHSEGLIEGDVRKGEFVIVCDQGEYNLSFVVSVSKLYARTSVGKIKHMSDFTALAQKSMDEAYQVFYSISFPYILKEVADREKLLYEAIRKEPASFHALEAYLTGIGRKNPVQVCLEKENYCFTKVTEDKKEQICLKKDNWGYISVYVKTDAEFITFEKNSLTGEDFLGSTCFFDYYIKADKLHAGKNFGRILFEFPKQTLSCEICVMKTEKQQEVREGAHFLQLQYRTRLMQLYNDYRTKKIVTGMWAKQSIELLDHLLELEPARNIYRLMKAQAFLVNKQRQEAIWILEDYKHSGNDKHTPEWGYYLYLCTLMEREESYVDRLTAQIEELFREYPDNPLLFWVLLFLREEYYKSSIRRLKAIERFTELGSHSPFFYLEAFYLYWQDPYLLTKLDAFEIKILNWGAKQHTISKEVAKQVVSLIPTLKVYDEKVFRILTACYEVMKEDEVLTVICGYLMKGQRFAKKYHKWYALGVKQELRITSLYEAYLLSADKESIVQMPKAVFMYFQYHNTLTYKQLALLYAHVIEKKADYKKEYQTYRRTIEAFALSQMEAGHMDENLEVIYKEVLSPEFLKENPAEKVANVLFVHKLEITSEKIFAKAVILQKQWKHRQIVSIVEKTAYFQAYTDGYVILLLDTFGQVFAEESLYKEKALLEIENYFDSKRDRIPKEPAYLAHYFFQKQREKQFFAEDGEALAVLMDRPEFNEEWKAKILPEYVRCTQSENILKDCAGRVNYKMMSASDRSFMIERFIASRMFDEAYEQMQAFGYDAVGNDFREEVCVYQIKKSEQEEDEFLLGLASVVFAGDNYDEVILGYLCRYYHGSVRQMAKIWKAAHILEAETFDMEERIITQMLYSGEYLEQADEIYAVYCQKETNDLVCRAYLSYFAQMYLVKDMVTSEQVFLQIEHRIFKRQETAEVQKYALLKYYSELKTLNDSQLQTADTLLGENICNHIYFAFYNKLDSRLKTKYLLEDKYFVEYYAKPKANVTISYYMNEENCVEETMPEVYDGIFVKSFVLFWGDKVSYYVMEEEAGEKEAKLSSQLEYQDDFTERKDSRYAMLNDIYKNLALQETQKAETLMKEYNRRKKMSQEMFKLL